jgi:hypothetical protein
MSTMKIATMSCILVIQKELCKENNCCKRSELILYCSIARRTPRGNTKQRWFQNYETGQREIPLDAIGTKLLQQIRSRESKNHRTASRCLPIDGIHLFAILLLFLKQRWTHRSFVVSSSTCRIQMTPRQQHQQQQHLQLPSLLIHF